jgi:hypothetical protein
MDATLILMLGLLSWPRIKRACLLKRWENALHLRKHLTVWNTLYQPVNGFELSRLARTNQDAFEYTYGEIDFLSFIALISLIQPTPTTRFYDLGSGTGKAVIACGLVFDMQAYYGIELFDGLHQAAIKVQEQLIRQADYMKNIEKMHFICRNFLSTDLTQASLIFINSTALFGPTWEALNEKLIVESAKNTVIITTSKRLLKSPKFILIRTTQLVVNFGIVMAYIHTTV